MKLLFVDNFRSVAILLIVMTHVVSFFNWEGTPQLEAVIRIIVGNSTALFVFISGYLFQYLITRFNYLSFLKTKIKYVALPYLITSIPAVLYFTFFNVRENMPVDFYSWADIYKIGYFYLTGTHLAPYWFIPAIFLFYSISPILKYFSDRRVLVYVFPLFLIISMLIPRDGVVFSFIHFISVYIAGMIACSYPSQLARYSRSNAIIVSLMLSFIIIIFIQYNVNVDSSKLYYFQKIILCILSLLIMKRYRSDSLLMIDLSVTSFGIFFIHSYVITLCKILLAFSPFQVISGGVFEVLILTVFVLGFCHFLVLAIQKILGPKSRIFIGS